MKKIVLGLLCFILLNSCSSEENNEEVTQKNEEEKPNIQPFSKTLKSYNLIFPSGNSTIHNFNGTKGVNVKKNENTIVTMQYNSNENLEKYTSIQSNGVKDFEYFFKYDSNNRISSIEVSNKKEYTISFKYTPNTIIATWPVSNTIEEVNTITVNNDQLITKWNRTQIHSFEENNKPVEIVNLQYEESFEYDNNKNCILAFRKEISPFADKEVSATYKFKYDKGSNPIHPFISKNYIQIAWIYAETASLFSKGISSNLVRTFGKNNHSETIYPDSFPDIAKFTYTNIYNTDNSLKETITKNSTGKTTVTTTFNY